MSGGVLGQVVDGVSNAVSSVGNAVGNVVNQVVQSPILRDAALVAGAIYAPELIASVGGDAGAGIVGSDIGAEGLAGGAVPASAASGQLAAQGIGTDLSATTGLAGGTTSLAPVANASAGLNPSFDTLGNVLQTGDMSSQLAPSITDLSGNAASGVSTLGGASTPVAQSMADIMTPTGYTYAGNALSTASALASAASALKDANTSLSPTQGSSSGFASPAGLSGGSTSGGGQGSTSPYNENLKLMGAYQMPIESVSTSGIVPTFKNLNAKKGGHINDHFGHPHYPKSPLETVFSTRGGTHYVQGAGTGQSDDIDAKLADGEYVFDADTVASLGDGSNKAGAQALDKMREAIRAHKRSAPDDKIPPKAKSPLAYLQEGNRK